MRLEAGRFQTEARLGGNKYLWLGTNKVFESFLYAFVPTDSGWVWAYGYRTGAGQSTFIVECSAGAWSGLGFDTLSAQDGISVLEKLFERHLDDHPLLGQVQPGASAGWLNFRTVTNQRWYDGSVVLAGDAAHTTHYSIGAGTTLAIEDAIVLAGHLRRPGQLELALESYERQRKAELLRSQSDARLSARWFESLPRYTGLEPRKFSALLHGRRSPLLPHLPPGLSYRLHQATEEVTVLGKLRRRVGPKAKAIYIRHNQARPGEGPATREHVKSWN
jgi:2-polyprenyl-6-methoxyphenol hydroxylase-like FAD-dependent oxidoreductase